MSKKKIRRSLLAAALWPCSARRPRPRRDRPQGRNPGRLRRQDLPPQAAPHRPVPGQGLGRRQGLLDRQEPTPQLREMSIAINRYGDRPQGPAGLQAQRHPALDHRRRARRLPPLAGRRRHLHRQRPALGPQPLPLLGQALRLQRHRQRPPGDPRPRLRGAPGADLLHAGIPDRPQAKGTFGTTL